MQETIADIQKRLRHGEYKNEEHVRLSLVARIVQSLGWNIWNPSEVNTEFIAIPHEDKTRVDMALFLSPWNIPSVFIEIKAVGKILNLSEIERQTRDYNRNNTAPISIITDGQSWKFYLSQTGGEFSQKRFLELDLLNDLRASDEIETEFRKFLSCDEIKSGESTLQAIHYLKRSRKDKVMEETYPQAVENAKIDPATSLAEHLLKLGAEHGEQITLEEGIRYCRERSSRPQELIAHPPIIPSSKSIPPPIDAQDDCKQIKNLRQGNCSASGYLLPGGPEFVVLKGSRAVLNHRPKLQRNNIGIRNNLQSLGVFVPDGESLLLTSDHTFNSISQAASVFLGRSANGHKEWK